MLERTSSRAARFTAEFAEFSLSAYRRFFPAKRHVVAHVLRGKG